MLTNREKEHITELSMMIAVPKMILKVDRQKIKRSRMQGILNRLQKHAVKAIRKTPMPDIEYSFTRLFDFFNAVKWSESSQVDVIVLVSFLLGVIEESESYYPPSIISALNDAFEWISEKNVDGELTEHLMQAEKAVALWKGRNIQDQEEASAA